MVERRKHHIRRYFNNFSLDIEILWLHDKLLFYLLVKKFLKPSKRNTGIILCRFHTCWTYLIIYLAVVRNPKINLNIISFLLSLYIILQISIAYPIIRKVLNYISYLLFLIPIIPKFITAAFLTKSSSTIVLKPCIVVIPPVIII